MNGTSYARFAHICGKCPDAEFVWMDKSVKGAKAIDIFAEFIKDTDRTIY